MKRQFYKYVSLNLLSMIGLSLYIFADTFFVANGIGRDGLAALNLAIPVFSLISAVGLLAGIGGATVYAVCRGRDDSRGGNEAFAHSLILALVPGVVFTVAGVFFSGTISRWLGADETLFSFTLPYVKTLLLFSFAFLVNQLLVCFVRNDGAPKLAMAAMLAGSFANIVLDYLFIFPLGWGMFGAAFATGLAPIISMGVLSAHFLRGRNHFLLKRCVFSWPLLRKIFVLGVPSFVNEFSSGVVMLLFNFTILRIAGNIGVAAYGVVANIALMAVAAFTGVAQGIQPLVSFSHGGGRQDEVRKVLWMGFVTAFLIGFGLYLVMAIFPGAVVGIFNRGHDEELQAIAVGGVPLYFIAFFFMGLNIVAASYFSSTERAAPSFLISVTRGLVAIVPLVLFLPFLWGMRGVWLVIPVTEVITFAVMLLAFRRKAAEPPGFRATRP